MRVDFGDSLPGGYGFFIAVFQFFRGLREILNVFGAETQGSQFVMNRSAEIDDGEFRIFRPQRVLDGYAADVIIIHGEEHSASEQNMLPHFPDGRHDLENYHDIVIFSPDCSQICV